MKILSKLSKSKILSNLKRNTRRPHLALKYKSGKAFIGSFNGERFRIRRYVAGRTLFEPEFKGVVLENADGSAVVGSFTLPIHVWTMLSLLIVGVAAIWFSTGDTHLLRGALFVVILPVGILLLGFLPGGFAKKSIVWLIKECAEVI